MGSKNVFHKNKSRCRDGAKCLQRTHVPVWKNQLAEKLQEQGGVPFHAQQSRLTFSGIKDTLEEKEEEEDEKRKKTTALSTRRRACASKQG